MNGRIGKPANFYISAYGIRMDHGNDDKTCLNHVELYGHELIDYYFESNVDEVVFGIDFSILKVIIAGISKKNSSIKIFKHKGKAEVYFKTNKREVIEIKPAKLELEIYQTAKYKREEIQPNCTVALSKFTNACNTIKRIGCDTVNITGYPNGIKMESNNDPGQASSTFLFGKCTDNTIINKGSIRMIVNNDNMEYINLNINSKLLTFMATLNNLVVNGTIKIYLEEHLPLKLIFKIGTYGQLTTYLR
jgi:hypothetical protein